MASPSTRRDLKALRRLINQADLALATIPDPHPSVASARESLNAALALAKELATESPAVALGSLGGQATAKKLGPEHYAKLASLRRNKRGGRPKSDK